MDDQPSVGVPARSSGPLNPPAFWLSLAGLVIQGLAALMLFGMYPYFSRYGWMMGSYQGMMSGYYAGGYGLTWWWVAAGAAAIGLGVVGVWLMSSNRAGTARTGAVLVLLAAVAAFPMMWTFWLGSILMLIGAVMGLVAGTGTSWQRS